MKIPLCLILIAGLRSIGLAYGDGPGVVQKATKDATKGSVEAVKESVGSADLTKGAKDVTKGVLDATVREAPAIEAQVVHQANASKTAIGGVAQEVSKDAVNGIVSASAAQLEIALGPHGDGPLADTLAATTQRLMASAVRGASSEIHTGIGVWALLLVFVLGGFSTVLSGIIITVLYITIPRRRSIISTSTQVVGAKSVQ